MGYPKGDRPNIGADNTKIRSCQSFFSPRHCHPGRSLKISRDTWRSCGATLAPRERLIQNSLVVFHQSLIPKPSGFFSQLSSNKSQNGYNGGSIIQQRRLRHPRAKTSGASFSRRGVSQKLSPTRNRGLSLLLRRQQTTFKEFCPHIQPWLQQPRKVRWIPTERPNLLSQPGAIYRPDPASRR